MSIFDELERLQSLYDRGVITADQYERGKARILNQTVFDSQRSAKSEVQRFRRSGSDRLLGGICGALSARTGVPAWIWRLILGLLFYVHWIIGLVYLLLWLLVPSEPRH